jgi:hypothetical protein
MKNHISEPWKQRRIALSSLFLTALNTHWSRSLATMAMSGFDGDLTGPLVAKNLFQNSR